MNKDSSVALIFEQGKKKPLASITLNGYNIRAGGPLGSSGAMRSFNLVRGNLMQAWDTQAALVLRAEDGSETNIRIAALPAGKDSFGLVEFI